MKALANHSEIHEELNISIHPAESGEIALPSALDSETSNLLVRMFRDPRILEPSERKSLVAQLRTAVELEPRVPEIRVLLGMALSVDLQVQEAMEQLRESTRQAPDCFIARLKFGELLMRLRICRQAEEETQMAARLASNAVQAELARKQAAAIRVMLREGIERGGWGSLVPRIFRPRRKSRQQSVAPVYISAK